MITKIWVSNNWINIHPENTINSTRRLNSFCCANLLPNCVVKIQGGWYYIDSIGILHFIERNLNQITFKNLYKLLK